MNGRNTADQTLPEREPVEPMPGQIDIEDYLEELKNESDT